MSGCKSIVPISCGYRAAHKTKCARLIIRHLLSSCGLPANLIQRLRSVQNVAARLIFIIRRSEHITPALINRHWLRVPEGISFKLAVIISYDVFIYPWHLSVLLTVVFHPCSVLPWHPDDSCGLLPHIVWTFSPFVSLQSASGRFRFLVPPSGTTCLSTSHLRRHSRFSDNDSRPFCFSVPTQQTLSYDSCVTITVHHYCMVLAIINII